MAAPKIFPLNDFFLKVKLKDVPTDSVTPVPLTSGVVTGFLSTTKTPTATAADASFVVTISHVSAGTWRVAIDAAVLVSATMATHFTSPAKCYLIMQLPSGFRVYVELDYAESRAARVA